MNTETLRSDWTEFNSKIKARFGKLTDESIESLKGNVDLLSAKLQSVYGYAKEQADKECAGFKATIHAATEPEKKPVAESERKPSVEDTKTPIGQEAKKVA